MRQAVTAAGSMSDDVDREIEATRLLLTSFATSPALKAGDLRTFYEQLVEAPKPRGAWFMLWDNERELLSTLRPFGSTLSHLSDYAGGSAFAGNLRESLSGFVIGGRTHGMLSAADSVPLYVRLEDVNGRMTGFLAAALPLQTLGDVAARQRLPGGWAGAFFDRRGKAISRGEGDGIEIGGPPVERAMLKSTIASEGYFTARQGSEPRAAYAFSLSDSSGYLALVKLPLADVNAPIVGAISQIALAGLLLALAGALAFAILSREAAAPLGDMINRTKSTEAELRAANAHLHTVLAGISDCYMTLDSEFRITDINDAALAWLEKEESVVVGTPLWDVVPQAAEANKATRRCMLERRPLHLELPSALHPGHWLDFRIYPSADGVSIFFRDVTERRHAIEEAEETRKLLQSSVDAISAPLMILDERMDVIFSNKAWKEWRATRASDSSRDGETADSWSGMGGVFADGSSEDVRAGLRMLFAAKGTSLRLSFMRDGRTFHLSAALFRMEDKTRAVVVVEDITQVTNAKDEIAKLSRSLLSLQEAERRRIAVELHDSTAQHLVALGLGIMRLRHLASAGDTELICDQMAGSVDEALREIRSFSYLLHPPKLEAEGLEGSLRSFLDGFSERTGLVTSLRWQGDADILSFEAQRSLLRVVQEALMNVHRHADAARVWVSAGGRTDRFRIRILDDGRGMRIPVDGQVSAEGVGIPGMRSRLRHLGGDLIILSGRRGTVVIATVPIVASPAPDPGSWFASGESGFQRERVRV
jgi:signal transduction histidine kinase